MMTTMLAQKLKEKYDKIFNDFEDKTAELHRLLDRDPPGSLLDPSASLKDSVLTADKSSKAESPNPLKKKKTGSLKSSVKQSKDLSIKIPVHIDEDLQHQHRSKSALDQPDDMGVELNIPLRTQQTSKKSKSKHQIDTNDSVSVSPKNRR